MNLSARAKVLIGFGVVIAVVVWLVLLDYGLNAGRIHYGVHVRGVDVGGMTLVEAKDVLDQEADKLIEEPVVISAEGIQCNFEPRALGWRPRSMKTAHAARVVGFRGSVVTDLRERLQTWFTGVEIDWVGEPKPRKVTALIDDCEAQAEALGVTVDRDRLRRLVSRSIVTWPRSMFEVPIEAPG